MSNSVRTRAIVEGALMAGLTAILALVGIYLPFVRIFTDLIWTIPVVLVTVRHGVSTGLMTIIVAGLLIFSLSSPVEAVILIIQFGGLALIYGYGFRKQLKPGLTLLMGAGTAVISILLVFSISLLIFGVDILNFAEHLKASIEPTILLYEKLGFFEKYAAQGFNEQMAREMLKGFIQLISLVIPALIAIYGLTSAFLNYFVAQKILVKMKIPVPVLPPIIYWRLPWWTVYGFILGFGLKLAGAYFNNLSFATIGLNIMLIYWPVLFILGVAVLRWFMHKYLKGAFIYRLLLLLTVILFFQYAIWVIASIGLADLLFNYRKLPGES